MCPRNETGAISAVGPRTMSEEASAGSPLQILRPTITTATVMVGPRTMSGVASAGSVLQILRPTITTSGQRMPVGAGTAMTAGVCHCNKCTRVVTSEVQAARAWAGEVLVPEVAVRASVAAEGLTAPSHILQLALTTVTINDGGVGAVLTAGTIGRSADGVWFKPCVRCKGLAFSSTHPYAFRWSCTDCGFTNVFARWRLGSAESVPPLSSCAWAEHALIVRVSDAVVGVCFDTRLVLQLPLALAMVLRGMSLNWGLVSETAIAFATVLWCASHLKTMSGRHFGAVAMASASSTAVVTSQSEGGWVIDDGGVVCDTEWSARSTSGDNDLVSIGFAMDNSMDQLRASLSQSAARSAAAVAEQESASAVGSSEFVNGKTAIDNSTWAYSREHRLWQRRANGRGAEEAVVS